MKRFLAPALLAFGLATSPAQAFDIDAMSQDERAAFGAEIRAYLLENPQVIMEAVAVLEQRQAATQVANDSTLIQTNAAAIFDDGYSWVGGNLDGDITLVEFIDYRCGYCRKAHDEVAELVKSDGNIRFVVKEFPILGEASTLSSRFAIAVKQTLGNDAYKLANDALIAMRSDINASSLTKLAKGLGFDPAPLLAHMDSDSVSQEIANTRALAQRLNISGTPTFVLQNELLRGYLPLANMREVVKDQRG